MTRGKRFLAKLLWSISPDLFFHLSQVLILEISAAALVAAFVGGYCVRLLAAAASAAALEVSLYSGMVEMVPGSFAHVVSGTQEGCLLSAGSDELPFIIVLVGSFVLFLAALVGSFKVWGARGSSGRAAAFERVRHKGLVISSVFALEGVLALVSRFSVIEGLNRHVLAGSLFSGTGEQASGRVDVPGKDIQQQAAAANETMCFFGLRI